MIGGFGYSTVGSAVKLFQVQIFFNLFFSLKPQINCPLSHQFPKISFRYLFIFPNLKAFEVPLIKGYVLYYSFIRKD